MKKKRCNKCKYTSFRLNECNEARYTCTLAIGNDEFLNYITNLKKAKKCSSYEKVNN